MYRTSSPCTKGPFAFGFHASTWTRIVGVSCGASDPLVHKNPRHEKRSTRGRRGMRRDLFIGGTSGAQARVPGSRLKSSSCSLDFPGAVLGLARDDAVDEAEVAGRVGVPGPPPATTADLEDWEAGMLQKCGFPAGTAGKVPWAVDRHRSDATLVRRDPWLQFVSASAPGGGCKLPRI